MSELKYKLLQTKLKWIVHDILFGLQKSLLIIMAFFLACELPDLHCET